MPIDLSSRKLEHTARLMVPQLLLFVLLVLNMASLPIAYADAIKAHLVLMAIYYWAIYRPTLIPPSVCFLAGLAMDVLGGFPPGLNALILVLLQWIVRDQRKFLISQPYIVIWLVFGLVAFAASMMQWGLHGLANAHWVKLQPTLADTLISLFLFPFVTLLLILTHRFLPVAGRTYP